MVLNNGIEHIFGIWFQFAVKIPLIAHLPYIVEIIHCCFSIGIVCKADAETVINVIHILGLIYAAVKACIERCAGSCDFRRFLCCRSIVLEEASRPYIAIHELIVYAVIYISLYIELVTWEHSTLHGHLHNIVARMRLVKNHHRLNDFIGFRVEEYEAALCYIRIVDSILIEFCFKISTLIVLIVLCEFYIVRDIELIALVYNHVACKHLIEYQWIDTYLTAFKNLLVTYINIKIDFICLKRTESS